MPSRGRAGFTLLVTTAAIAAVLLPAALAPSAAHAVSYRYWSYWVSSGDGWTYSSQGAGSFRPKDGSVQGWRFAVSQGASSSTTTPRTAPSFASLCQGVKQTAGTRRVGLVIDYGIASDAPSGEKPPAQQRSCVLIADGDTGLTVLTAVTSIRAKGGLVCGISGFPKAECTAIVKQAPAAPPTLRPTASSGGPGSSTSPLTRSNGDTNPRSTSSATAPATAAAKGSAPSTATPRTTPSAVGPSSVPGEPIDVIDATQTSAAGNAGTPLPTAIAFALIVAIAAAVLIARRRRT